MTVISPCIQVCELDGGVCGGCGRTIEEIVAWGSLSDTARESIMARLARAASSGDLSAGGQEAPAGNEEPCRPPTWDTALAPRAARGSSRR